MMNLFYAFVIIVVFVSVGTVLSVLLGEAGLWVWDKRQKRKSHEG